MKNLTVQKSIKPVLILMSFMLTLLMVPAQSEAQDVSIGADVMSRYVWRGADFGNSPSIQPSLSFASGGFEIGTWGAYPISQSASSVEEHDLYIGYTAETESSGAFSFGFTDYYFPTGGAGFFDFEGDGGGHWFEPNVGYSGPSSFPISLYGAMLVHNDPDNSVYLEAGYPVYEGDDTEVSLSVGGTPQESGFYGTDKAGILSMSLSASKGLKITDDFTLPLSASYIANPYHEVTYLVFGFSL